ncbi:hypothetical protein SLS58_010484 [Diplodia intermedia]|uniref:Uncharacterized protein n=1 Tax=Diplodia intermedia TaxID=856260 RepID=A0ABR3T5M1_9PEZI
MDISHDTAGQDHIPASVSIEDDQELEESTTVEQLKVLSPHSLDSAESLLLEYYIGCFSRTYPTFSGPTNPFLSVLLPIAMQSRMVLDSLLTVSGARIWDYGWSGMERETLKLRQRALSGCRRVLERYNNTNQRSVTDTANATSPQPTMHHSTIPPAENLDPADFLPLLTSATLFLLYDMLMGEENFRPHLEFIDWLFRRHFLGFNNGAHKQHPLSVEAFRFLYNCFLYNDLVRSTSLGVPTASDFYVRAVSSISDDPFPHETIQDQQSRYYFPSLIARISAQDTTVSEGDIEAWNGRLDWLPSLCLVDFHGAKADVEALNRRATGSETARLDVSTARGGEYSKDRDIISQLYRVTARIYRRQSFGGNPGSFMNFEDVDPKSSSSLASAAIQLVQQLSEGSAFDSALLWPIGICGRELTGDQVWERHYVIFRLQQLEKRFRMKHFQRAQQVLANTWSRKDQEAMHDSVMYSCGWKRLDLILLG